MKWFKSTGSTRGLLLFVVLFAITGGVVFSHKSYAVSEYTFGTALNGGDCLAAGKGVKETGGANHLDMQTDGNLVLYSANNIVQWATNTNGTGSSNKACMQTDGNLVVYNGANKALWQSYTYGVKPPADSGGWPVTGYRLDFLSTGVFPDELSIQTLSQNYTDIGQSIWVSGRRAALELGFGEGLSRGQSLTSANGIYHATLLLNGDFAVYHGAQMLWDTKSVGNMAVRALFNDMNVHSSPYTTKLSLVNSSGQTVWSGHYSSFDPAFVAPDKMIMQSDGNLVVYLTNGKVAWSTGTAGK